jgi:hypothetical protein
LQPPAVFSLYLTAKALSEWLNALGRYALKINRRERASVIRPTKHSALEGWRIFVRRRSQQQSLLESDEKLLFKLPAGSLDAPIGKQLGFPPSACDRVQHQAGCGRAYKGPRNPGHFAARDCAELFRLGLLIK